MKKQSIQTKHAPAAIGTYSQAIQVDNTIYISGQIPLIPDTMELITDDFKQAACQVFDNIKAICQVCGATLDHIVKLTVYLTDLSNVTLLNEIMEKYFSKPYPARVAIQVAALPKAAPIEIDAIVIIMKG